MTLIPRNSDAFGLLIGARLILSALLENPDTCDKMDVLKAHEEIDDAVTDLTGFQFDLDHLTPEEKVQVILSVSSVLVDLTNNI